MSVVRVNKNENYTTMSNYHLQEKEMSLKAKGLLSLMLSLPSDWDYSIGGLVAICKENETAINSTLKELKEFGYLKVTKLMPNETKTGRFEYVYDIYETSKQDEEKQGIENLCVENQAIEFQGQQNTNNKFTNVQITNNKEKISKKEIETEFESLWKRYPRKMGKESAYKSYVKARQNGTTYDEVINGLENYLKEIEVKKTDKQYIKHGSTWFSQHCWQDEYVTTVEEKPNEYDSFVSGLNKWLESED